MLTELSNIDIDALLAAECMGHLGCFDGAKPHVYPMAYAFKDNVLYGQTLDGAKVAILREHPTVCFQVEAVRDHGWRSVIVWGSFEELDTDALTSEAAQAAALLSTHLADKQEQFGLTVPFRMDGSFRSVSVDGRSSTLFRIVVHEKTGRQLRKG